MTCVLSSPWQPFSPSYGWSPMNTGSSMSTSTGSDKPHHGYISSESESRQPSSSSGKKRASRAGTRSVTTLSAAQLERKRANDREAQRAIRQRTKDHIDSLERNVNDLKAAHDASEKMVAATRQRNRELEDENAYLRSKLGEAGYPVSLPPSDSQRAPDGTILSVHPNSPGAHAGSGIQRPDSTSTPQGGLSMSAPQSALPRHGSWQPPSSLSSTAGGSTPTLSAPGTMQIGSTLTTWRSHESSPSIHSNSGQLHEPPQAQPSTHYAPGQQHDRSQWSATSQPYSYQEQQRNQQFEAPVQQQQPQYGQPSVPTYGPGAAPPQPGYAAAHQPPQAEFQGMAVSSPAAYQHTFPPTAQYPMGPLQVSPAPSNPEYAPQPSHMQAPPVSATPYHQVQSEQQYSQQQMQPNMQFRDDSGSRGYSLTHYPSG